MNISEISIRNPVFAWMLMAALILFGAIGFSRMGVSELPDVDFPVLNVSTSWEGAAPEVMESDIIDPIEDTLMGVAGVREISSTARQGLANITVEFELSKDIDVAFQEVQTRLSQVSRTLPLEMDPPRISKINPEDHPILWIALSGEKSRLELMEYARDHIKDPLQTVTGVGEIFLGGFVDPNLRIWLKHEKLNEYELTVEDILNTIRKQHIELPAGRIETDAAELNIRMLGEMKSPEEFENLIIPSRGGRPIYRPIYLKDVATVELGLADIRRITRTNGKPAVGLGVRKQRGANAVQVARAVKLRLEDLKKELPPGFTLHINFDGTRFIEESVGELKFTLFLAALLTSIVCWIFLGSWSATFNVLMAIPTSIIGTFLVLYFFGFTLNTFTLLGLVLAVGIVVDDAIMVLENIFRHQEEGENRFTAALKGSKQITFAALATTLSLVAIFLPVAFMKGVIGKFFLQYGVTISVAVLLSLLEALTLTPMRCSQFVEAKGRSSEFFQKWAVRYRGWLERCLDRPVRTLLISILIFIVSMSSFFGLKKEFSPSQDQSIFMVTLKTPVGSSIDFTSQKVKLVEEFLAKQPEVLRYFVSVGGFGGGEVNSGMLFVTLKPRNERKISQQEFMNFCRKEFLKISDLKSFLLDFSMRGITAQRGFPVELSLRGSDWEALAGLSEKIKQRMEQDKAIFQDVDTDHLTGMPEVQVVPNREKAEAHGVQMEEITRTIQAMVGGVREGKFQQDGRRMDIRVRLVPEERNKPEDIRSLYVRNDHGERVLLSDVVTIQQVPSLLTITRKNRERSIGIFSNMATGVSQSEAIEKAFQLGNEILPEGYRLVSGGSAQTFKESFQSLAFAMLLGIIVAYMILASQFNSFVHPFTVLLALPFSLSGALVALFLTGHSLNIYSFIGIILLMGIVKKNSILLVDFTNQRVKEGLGVREALLSACPIRLRPILMTSVATVVAAIPPALALGPGSETRIPMAVTVIGGVLLSTALTLFVIPCAYLMMKGEWRKIGVRQSSGGGSGSPEVSDSLLSATPIGRPK